MGRKIALMGIPGSGKTELAHALEDAIVLDDAGCVTCNTPVSIVDEYAEYIRDHGEYAIGVEGGWMSSVAIAVDRYSRERHAMFHGMKTVITCGTIIESSVYSAMHFEEMFPFANTDDERSEMSMRIEGTLKFFGTLYADTFPQYTDVYYLPAQKAVEGERFDVVDRNLQAAFQAFNLVSVKTLVGTVEEQVAQIMGKEDDGDQVEEAESSASTTE